MEWKYHRLITHEAIGEFFDPAGMQTIIKGNLSQDRPIKILLHPYRHVDDGLFAAAETYIRQEREQAVSLMAQGRRRQALLCFGRLLHTRQDFYAHSNWVALWVTRHGGPERNRPADVDICTDPVAEEELRSGKAAIHWFIACHLPLIGPWFAERAPADTHEAMNLDHPGRGPLFPFAVAAATKHTRQEFGLFMADLGAAAGQEAVRQFLGQQIADHFF
jgi:hypothetical protein